MRHLKARKRLGHGTSHRKAILRNMATSLFRHDQIETTEAKAKQLKPVAEKMITLAKRGDLHARRQALSYLTDKAVVHRLFSEVKERYLDRQGGYVRIVKKGMRKGDGAPVSIIQLLVSDGEKKRKEKKKKKTSPVTGTASGKPETEPKSPVKEEVAPKTEETAEEGKAGNDEPEPSSPEEAKAEEDEKKEGPQKGDE